MLNHITALYTAQGSTFLRWRRASHAGEVSSRHSSRVGEGVRGSGGRGVRGSEGQGVRGSGGRWHRAACVLLPHPELAPRVDQPGIRGVQTVEFFPC